MLWCACSRELTSREAARAQRLARSRRFTLGSNCPVESALRDGSSKEVLDSSRRTSVELVDDNSVLLFEPSRERDTHIHTHRQEEGQRETYSQFHEDTLLTTHFNCGSNVFGAGQPQRFGGEYPQNRVDTTTAGLATTHSDSGEPNQDLLLVDRSSIQLFHRVTLKDPVHVHAMQRIRFSK